MNRYSPADVIKSLPVLFTSSVTLSRGDEPCLFLLPEVSLVGFCSNLRSALCHLANEGWSEVLDFYGTFGMTIRKQGQSVQISGISDTDVVVDYHEFLSAVDDLCNSVAATFKKDFPQFATCVLDFLR